MIKLLMSWDIKPGSEREYFEFIVREFGPGIIKLGIQPTESWYTVFGNGAQILIGGVAEDMPTLQSILDSSDWKNLQNELFNHVTNFKSKIVRPIGRFQLL